MAAQLIARYLSNVNVVHSTHWVLEHDGVYRIVLRTRVVDPQWSQPKLLHKTKWVYLTETTTRTLYPKTWATLAFFAIAATVLYEYTYRVYLHNALVDLEHRTTKDWRRTECIEKAIAGCEVHWSNGRIKRKLEKALRM